MDKEKWSYSFDEEHFVGEHNTKEEAITEAKSFLPATIWVGQNKKPIIADYFYYDNFIERIKEELYDDELGFVDDYDIIVIDDNDVFKKEIKKLITKHCSTKYYSVHNIECVKI